MIEVVAEIGKNFCVTEKPEPLEVLLERAKTLILQAKNSGADTVKFQVHNVEDEIHWQANLASPHFKQDRYEWVKRNTYPVSFWMEIRDYCQRNDIEFMATPMSRGAAILLDVVGVNRWKIGSADILDFPLLDYIRNTHKPVILSSGMSTIQELRQAYEYLAEEVDDITILHCISNYPCKLEDLNLLTIPFLKKQFPKAKIGFSDHSLGYEGAMVARQLGAKVIEKHFTLDRESWGPDHKVSLTPEELATFVRKVKGTQNSIFIKVDLGVETKFINEGELKFRKVFRKGLYAARYIPEGRVITKEDIMSLRPKLEHSQPSENYPQVIGQTAQKEYRKYDKIS